MSPRNPVLKTEPLLSAQGWLLDTQAAAERENTPLQLSSPAISSLLAKETLDFIPLTGIAQVSILFSISS